MTLWKNESEDIIQIDFDLGKGKREQRLLAPQEEIEIPNKLDRLIPMEVPQLKVVKLLPKSEPKKSK